MYECMGFWWEAERCSHIDNYEHEAIKAFLLYLMIIRKVGTRSLFPTFDWWTGLRMPIQDNQNNLGRIRGVDRLCSLSWVLCSLFSENVIEFAFVGCKLAQNLKSLEFLRIDPHDSPSSLSWYGRTFCPQNWPCGGCRILALASCFLLQKSIAVIRRWKTLWKLGINWT